MVNHLHFCNTASGWSAFYVYLSPETCFNEDINTVFAPKETFKCRLKLCVFSEMYKKSKDCTSNIEWWLFMINFQSIIGHWCWQQCWFNHSALERLSTSWCLNQPCVQKPEAILFVIIQYVLILCKEHICNFYWYQVGLSCVNTLYLLYRMFIFTFSFPTLGRAF